MGGACSSKGSRFQGCDPIFPWPWSCSRAQPSHPSPPEPAWEREIFHLFLATRVAVEALPLPAACGRIPLDALSQRCCCIPSSQLAFSSRWLVYSWEICLPRPRQQHCPGSWWLLLFLISVPMILLLHPLPTPRCCWCLIRATFCYCCTHDQLLFALDLWHKYHFSYAELPQRGL